MARDTFGQYGLSFKAPTFDFSGLGALYSNKVKRDELIDLARKKRIQDKYGADFMLSGAPVKPPTPDFGPSPLETPVDPRLVNSGIFGTGDGFKIQGGDAGRADEQYMEDLAAFQDPSNTYYMTPTDRTYGPNEDVQLQKDDTFKLLDDGSTVVTRGEKTPYSYSGDPEMDEYNKQKAIYDELVAAGFVPGSTLGEQTFGQLANVETIGADQTASMRELGYNTIDSSNSSALREERYRQRGAIGEKLRSVESELVAHLNGTRKLDPEVLKSKYNEFNQLLSKYDATGTRYQGAVSVFDLQNAVSKELREDEKLGMSRESHVRDLTKIKSGIGKEIRSYAQEFSKSRKKVADGHNEAAKNARAFAAAAVVPLSTSSYQAMLKGINKMLEPNSAVMQGEANAFMGDDIANRIRSGFNSIKTGLNLISSKLGVTFDEEGNPSKPKSVDKSDWLELVELYNQLIPTLASGKQAIESGTGEYFTNISKQLKAEYSDSVDDMDELLNKKRFQSILNSNLYLEELPTSIEPASFKQRNVESDEQGEYRQATEEDYNNG